MALTILIGGLLLGLTSPAALQAGVEAFAGRPALVDQRLLLPLCAEPAFAWSAGGRSVTVRCAAPEWQVFVPLAGAPSTAEAALPAVRRGDRVTLEVGGDGFVIGMDAVAEADSRDGRVALRAVNGGRRLTGTIGADGHIRLRGLSTMVNGR